MRTTIDVQALNREIIKEERSSEGVNRHEKYLNGIFPTMMSYNGNITMAASAILVIILMKCHYAVECRQDAKGLQFLGRNLLEHQQLHRHS